MKEIKYDICNADMLGFSEGLKGLDRLLLQWYYIIFVLMITQLPVCVLWKVTNQLTCLPRSTGGFMNMDLCLAFCVPVCLKILNRYIWNIVSILSLCIESAINAYVAFHIVICIVLFMQNKNNPDHFPSSWANNTTVEIRLVLRSLFFFPILWNVSCHVF